MTFRLAIITLLLFSTGSLLAQDSVDDQHTSAKQLSMAGQSHPQTKLGANKEKKAPVRTKTYSSLFSEYKEGVFVQNNTKYAIALANESALAAANRLKISYHKLLKYNDLQEGEPLIQYQYIYMAAKKTHFSASEPAFFRVENGETLYEIAQFYGIRLLDLQQRNGLTEGEEVANGELILLNQRAVSKPKLRPKELVLSATQRLQPIKVEEILAKEQTISPQDTLPSSTYPDYIYETSIEKETLQLQINLPTDNQVKPPATKSKASVSLFGRPAIVDKED
jgi:LysM repeat protein